MKEFWFLIARNDSDGIKHKKGYIHMKSKHLQGAIRKLFQEQPGIEIVRIIY